MKWGFGNGRISWVLSGFVLACWSGTVGAETPGEIPKPWTYEGSMKLQEQQRQQDQQFQQQQQQSPQGGRMAPGGGGGAAAAAADAARASWQKKPPLPPERNPLLGSWWTRPASTRPNPNDPFGQLQALAKGGLCEVLFGGGVFEFRPDRLVGKDARTPEQELDRVEYRGDEKHVVVLPKTSLKLIEFDFDGSNRISWKSQNCVLVRVGSTSTGSAGAPPTATGNSAGSKVATAAPAGGSHPASGGVLMLTVGATSSTDKVAGRKLWVLKGDPQFTLIRAGLTSTPYGTVLQNWMRACQKRDQICATGMQALQGQSVGFATTDGGGHAQTPPLPAGRYWVLSDAKVDNKHLMWSQPVDVKGAEASVTLDQRNAMPVD
jgi:hypothetical protein